MKLSDFNEVKELVFDLECCEKYISQVNNALETIGDVTLVLGRANDVWVHSSRKGKLLEATIVALTDQKQDCTDKLAELGWEV